MVSRVSGINLGGKVAGVAKTWVGGGQIEDKVTPQVARDGYLHRLRATPFIIGLHDRRPTAVNRHPRENALAFRSTGLRVSL